VLFCDPLAQLRVDRVEDLGHQPSLPGVPQSKAAAPPGAW
jgi:hypothetical protein